MPKYPLGELAGAIEARLEGDPSVEVSGVSALETAGPDDLSFLANPRYASAARGSAAAALIVGTDYPSNGQNLLRSDNPYLTYARAVTLLFPPDPVEPGIDETAVVHPSAQVSGDATVGPQAVIAARAVIGRSAVIGAGCIISEEVTVGDGTTLHPRVIVQRGTRIGRRCVVQSGSVLGSEGFGYATDSAGVHHKVPQRGGLVVGDNVEIGANVTIDRGSVGDTVIGDGTKIDNLVHIGHNVRVGPHSMLVAQVGIAGSTRVGAHAVLGGQAGVVGHATIGERARIGAQAGVIGDVPAGAEYSGYPARSHREQMRANALFTRLPELFERLKILERDRSG